MPFVSQSNRKIHYSLEGKGDDFLLFSNSLGQTTTMWNQQVATFEDEFRIIRFDHPGHGSSDLCGEATTVAEMAGDALAVLDAIGVPRVHFIGLSLGGMIGQQLAVDAPERLHSVTLCATAAQMPPPESWEQRAVTALADGMEPFVQTSSERWFTKSFRDASVSVVNDALDVLRGIDARGYAACCRAIRDFDFRERVQDIHVPTLLLAGAADPSAPPSSLSEIHQLVQNSIFEIINDSAHLLNIEQAAEFSVIIHNFIRNHGKETNLEL